MFDKPTKQYFGGAVTGLGLGFIFIVGVMESEYSSEITKSLHYLNGVIVIIVGTLVGLQKGKK